MNPVIFLHVPKACGTTLNKLLDRWCPPEEIYKVGTKPREEPDAGGMEPQPQT